MYRINTPTLNCTSLLSLHVRLLLMSYVNLFLFSFNSQLLLRGSMRRFWRTDRQEVVSPVTVTMRALFISIPANWLCTLVAIILLIRIFLPYISLSLLFNSGKTWTMGSSSSDIMAPSDSFGIIPRVIKNLFEIISQKEEDDPNSTYKVQVQFLEIYGEDIKDLLDQTKTTKVDIRESASGEVFVSGAREEAVSSPSQMMRALVDGSRHRTTASTLMNSSSSRSHGKPLFSNFLLLF